MMQPTHVPSVSVVIPCYNSAPFLGETIRSVLDQTNPPIEVLVINDGSTDESGDVARSFGPPVHVMEQANQGKSVSCNRGIAAARGDWIAFLDADDLWEPEKLAKQLAAVDEGVACVHTNYYSFGAWHKTHDHTGIPEQQRYTLPAIVRHRPFNMSALLVRRDLSPRYPARPENYNEDLLYILQLPERGSIRLVAEPLVGYRRHPRSMRATHAGVETRLFQVLEWWLAEQGNAYSRETASEVLEAGLYWLVRGAREAKRDREWQVFWAARELLQKYRDRPVVARFFGDAVFPRWVYAATDAGRWMARRAKTMVRSLGSASTIV